MPSPDTLVASALSAGYGTGPVLESVDLIVAPGRLTALVGPNGSGKSTLLRSLAGLLVPAKGSVTLGGVPIASMPRKALARHVSFLPQAPLAPDGLTVIDLMRQGRYPHRGLFSRWSPRDDEIVEDALALSGLASLRDRPLASLSGGQRQRVWIAMSLVQQAAIMLLDEPTSFLDVAHQFEVLDLLRELVASRGATVVIVHHDLGQAARYADHVAVMQAGRLVAAGAPGTVLTPALIADIFEVRARVLLDPADGERFIVTG